MTNLFAILVLYIAGTLAVQSCSPLSILTSRTGEISSNAEGQTYSANANCTWVIRPTSINSGEVIVLFFESAWFYERGHFFFFAAASRSNNGTITCP